MSLKTSGVDWNHIAGSRAKGQDLSLILHLQGSNFGLETRETELVTTVLQLKERNLFSVAY